MTRYEPHCDCNGGHVSMVPDPNGRWCRADDVSPAGEWDAHKEFTEAAAFARKAFAYICGDISARTPTVGRHEAKNNEHLRRIYVKSRETFPQFADTLAWLLWHDILHFDRWAALTKQHPVADDPSGIVQQMPEGGVEAPEWTAAMDATCLYCGWLGPAWNRRATEADLRAEVERLQAGLRMMSEKAIAAARAAHEGALKCPAFERDIYLVFAHHFRSIAALSPETDGGQDG